MATTPVKKKLKAFQLYAPRTSALLFCMPTFSTLPLAYLLRFFYFIHKNKKKHLFKLLCFLALATAHGMPLNRRAYTLFSFYHYQSHLQF